MRILDTVKTLVALSLIIAIPFCLWGILSSQVNGFGDNFIMGFYGFANGLLFSALVISLSFISRHFFHYASWLVIFLSYSIIIPVIFYYFTYKHPLSSASITILLDTNHLEAAEFFHSFTWPTIVAFFLSFLSVQVFMYFSTRPILQDLTKRPAKTRILYLCAIAVIYVAAILENDLLYRENMFIALNQVYESYQDDKESMRRQREAFKTSDHHFNVSRHERVSGQETYVMVIGESQSRHHLSLYGYQRNTNPKLSSLNHDLQVFTDVISPHSTTILCLQKMLTFANFEDPDALFSKPGILELANKAGFETYWITNQSFAGQHDSWTTLFSEGAKVRTFTNFVNSINSMPVYDEAVLKPLDEALRNPAKKKFIVIHLIGSHQRADFRFPLSFNKFRSFSDQPLIYPDATLFAQRYVNSYDNSILYNDHIIYEIIRRVKSRNNSSFVLYLPDHGEEVFERTDFFGHLEEARSRYMIEIPMILWQSGHHRKQVEIKPAALTRPYQTDDLIHSLHDLLQIRSDYYLPQKSILSDSFRLEKRYYHGMDYDSLYPNLPKTSIQ